MPRVSIIIPCYNREKLLKETLLSCLRQNFSDIEILVVDDGSTDASRTVAETLARQDPRIRIIASVNQGVCIARNTGLALAQGEYVWFLDSDDLLMPYAVEFALGKAEQHRCPMVVCGEGGFSEDPDEGQVTLEEAIRFSNRKYLDQDIPLTHHADMLDFIKQGVGSCNGILIQRELCIKAGGFSPYLRAAEENHLMHMLAFRVPPFPIVRMQFPIVVLKRIAKGTLARQAREDRETHWGLRSQTEIARALLRLSAPPESFDSKTFWQSLYLNSAHAARQGYWSEAHMALSVWERAHQPRPFLTPFAIGCLHKALGFSLGIHCHHLLSKIKLHLSTRGNP